MAHRTTRQLISHELQTGAGHAGLGERHNSVRQKHYEIFGGDSVRRTRWSRSFRRVSRSLRDYFAVVVFRGGSSRSLRDYFAVVVFRGGSVIAYDTFYAMVNEGSHDALLRSTDLITFGSPLDKTAFVFRSQKVARADFREALATQVQAMLVRHQNRPASWTNIYSKDDWISGELNFYGDLSNHPDTESCIPVVAHVQYWRNNLVFDIAVRKVQSLVLGKGDIVEVYDRPLARRHRLPVETGHWRRV